MTPFCNEEKQKIFRLNGLILTLEEGEDALLHKAAQALGLSVNDIRSLDILKKALDARRNRAPFFVYAVKITLSHRVSIPQCLPAGIQLLPFLNEPNIHPPQTTLPTTCPVIVIGAGPAGLFAAYQLVTSGMPVLLLERGRPVEQRIGDVENFWRHGDLNPQSNVLFGEGGAGTFSDGKLTSRSKNPYAGKVKQILVEMGASSSILTDAKPHIGTDKLRKLLIRFRECLTALGCNIHFGAQVTDFIFHRDVMASVIVNGEEEIKAQQVVLAVGQSADDTYRMLKERGVKLEPKPFAVGLRVEHPQNLINRLQYGRWSNHPKLPPAEYFVTAALDRMKRSVYTFCMCPGGRVIGCSAFPETVITNGMSYGSREEVSANSAIVVNVRVEDFTGEGEPLAGLDFRNKWEKKAFEVAGGDYFAPAQRLTDFLDDKTSGDVGPTSFLPGVRAVRLYDVLPDFVAASLGSGIKIFNRKMPGFISPEAHLIGVETRTSSPVRICRGADGQSENVKGLYPCGEGAGYAGGIISSALDGVKAACQVLTSISGCR